MSFDMCFGGYVGWRGVEVIINILLMEERSWTKFTGSLVQKKGIVCLEDLICLVPRSGGLAVISFTLGSSFERCVWGHEQCDNVACVWLVVRSAQSATSVTLREHFYLWIWSTPILEKRHMWSVISSNPQCHRSPDCTWNPVFTYYIQLRDLGSYPLPVFFLIRKTYTKTYPKRRWTKGV